MTVLLRQSANPEAASTYAWWAAIADEPRGLDRQRVRPDMAADLERAFDDSASEWWAIARGLGGTRSAACAHAPAAAANVSDFGVMLAWTRLVDRWAHEPQATLVICDDPWLFRHFAARPGVQAGPAPAIWPRALQLWLRGTCARLVACLRFARAALMMRGDRSKAQCGGAWLLVYGHPASTPGGVDGYFGDLMQGVSSLARALHIDCPPRRARTLSGARTVSLHGFGNPLTALGLVFTRWRPRKSALRGPHGWLVRRAAALEGGTAQAAAVRWQVLCQAAWLRAVKPLVVAWPWENHGWERAFVRNARAAGVRTVGYQHSVIGRQMLNYAPHSAPDGVACLPDRILCAGESTRRRLLAWGVDSGRTAVGGALRFTEAAAPAHDPAAPVFLALPFDARIAREMVTTAQTANGGRAFLVKDHPMTPFGFTESARVRRTAEPLGRQAGVSAVIYAATTVGLEAILAGLPTLRFRPRGTVALDILPDGIDVPTVDATSIDGALAAPAPPPHIDRASVFAPVDMDLWRRHLEAA
jgi:hypothetical protein